MEIKPQDYIHFYIGQDVTICEYEGAPFTCKLTGLVTERTDHESMIRIQCFIPDEQEPHDGHIAWYDLNELVDIHLRKLSDMTEEEGVEIFGNEYGGDSPNVSEIIERSKPYEIHFSSTQFNLLLSNGFDLFGLIPAGLAIDKTYLKN